MSLPPKVSLVEILGQLRKRFPFAMQKVRDVVAFLMKKEENKIDY